MIVNKEYPAFFLILLICLCSCTLSTGGSFTPRDGGEIDVPGEDFDADTHIIDGVDVEVEVEIPPSCGNAAVEAGEECDDGNDTNEDGCDNNCRFSCHSNVDCVDSNPCNGEELCSVETHACQNGTPPSDGFVCSHDPRSICLAGECVESLCGDGFVDEGNGEFCEPSLDSACSDDCTYACSSDADCPDNAEACDGEEFCDLDARACSRRNPLPEGTECGSNPGVREICIGEVCQESTCNDGYVDTVTEECEDGNSVNGDGCDNDCTFSCHENTECDDAQICNGSETCDTASTHMCRPGTPAAMGTPCNDNLFCTAVDVCNGAGSCIGSGDRCNDGLYCTTDSCNEGTDTCSSTITDGYCLIAGNCYADGNSNPMNECQECRSSRSMISWTSKSDMTPCSSGVCCIGLCRTGGNCCDDTDCTGSECSGTALPCSTFTDGATCISQRGCLWAIDIDGCRGTLVCSDIDRVGSNVCLFTCHCSMSTCIDGTCWCGGSSSIQCFDLTNESDCRICGCIWGGGGGSCGGIHAECSTYTAEADCNTQQNCSWGGQTCSGYVCQ